MRGSSRRLGAAISALLLAAAAGAAAAHKPAHGHAHADRAARAAGEAHDAHDAHAPHVAPSTPPDVRAELADQLAAERASIEQAISAVTVKLAAADAARLHRLAAAARALHDAPPPDASTEERLAGARRVAASRYLLARDASERGLLADELAHLDAARIRTEAAARELATIALPLALGWPAPGKIVHHVGLYAQPRARAELSRRGIDIAVADRAPVVASAAGTVRYAGPIRGLDHGVIVDHGDYETVVAHLGELATSVGARVAAGGRLGRAAHHRVYLELRVKLGPGGLPIDPEPLLR